MKKLNRKKINHHINIEYKFKKLEEKKPIIFIGLGSKENKASFYDFLIWMLSNINGILYYNTDKDIYYLLEEKENINKKIVIYKHQIKDIKINLPNNLRHEKKLLNLYAKSPKKVNISQKGILKDITNDILINTNLPKIFDNNVKLEQNRVQSRDYQAIITFDRFLILKPFYIISLDNKTFGKDIFLSNKILKVYKIYLKGESNYKNIYSLEYEKKFMGYNLEYKVYLEDKEEEYIEYPNNIIEPTYPIKIEGIIVSENWEKEEEKCLCR